MKEVKIAHSKDGEDESKTAYEQLLRINQSVITHCTAIAWSYFWVLELLGLMQESSSTTKIMPPL